MSIDARRPSSYPRHVLGLAPLTRREFPGWGKVLRTLGVFDDSRWAGAPRVTIRGKFHGYRMDLDLANWSQRHTFFLGRFYDLPTQLALFRILRPGDRFVDVGANIGMITLLGARLVGESGRVDAFEPNPECARAIRAALADNAIRNVELHPMGLSDRPGTLTLRVVTEHSGMGTLARLEADEVRLVSAEYPVEIGVGDRVLDGGPPVMLVKVDVEGFEYNVLGGLVETLTRDRPAIITEVVSKWLARAGHDAEELRRMLGGLGYAPHALSTRRRGLSRVLDLRPLDPNRPVPDCDAIWVHPDSAAAARIGRRLAGRRGRG